ncbi:E3 ubiquitin-protein ligase Zswim2 [Ciborinia camelliae]|nr:E3 ubiquitin-protein ligase Zswim2 [Ciborinia camelliae]
MIRWATTQITESKCICCEAAIENRAAFILPPRTWISDLDYEKFAPISPEVLAQRTEFWKNIISDQAILVQRQDRYVEAYQAAVRELQEYDASDEVNAETRNELSQNVRRARGLQRFYDIDQIFYLNMVRSMGLVTSILLFDPTDLLFLNQTLLSLVKPEEISSEEICGICTEELYSSEENGRALRVFCGNHLFHQKCIVQWFETIKLDRFADQLSCPLCRKTQKFYSIPDNLDGILEFLDLMHMQVIDIVILGDPLDPFEDQ